MTKGPDPIPPVGRGPTQWETNQYRSICPSLTAFRVTGSADPAYNCVAWTVGCTDDWMWPTRTGPTTTPADFDAFYSGYGYTAVAPAVVSGSVKEADGEYDLHIALYTKDQDCEHVAICTPYFGWWESKMGAGVRMVHLLHDIAGSNCGWVSRYYQRVEVPSREEVAAAMAISGPVIAMKIEDQSGDILERFAEVYERWKKRVSQPDIALKSNPKYYVNIPEFDAIVELGQQALPLILAELASGEFWLNYAMERITSVHPPSQITGERAKSQWWLQHWTL